MSRRLHTACLGCWLTCLLVQADGGFLPPKDYSGKDLKEPCQRAILVHRDKRESLILFVDYEGEAKEFAWIIPTPTKPEAQTSDAAMFQEIASYYQSLRVAVWREDMRGRTGHGMGGAGGGAGPKEERVVVHAQKLIGPYETAVLSADGEDALLNWLLQHGYRVNEGAEGILSQYIKETWYFVAVKVRTGAGDRQSLPPLRLDFPTEKPVYPLRISALNRGMTDIRLYLLQGIPTAGRIKESVLSNSYRLQEGFANACPILAKQFPDFGRKNGVLSRLATHLPPQVLARLDDQLHGTPSGRGERDMVFFPYSCVGKTVGIADAMLSKEPDEREWGETNLFYYRQAARSNRDWPEAQSKALSAFAEKHRDELRKRLLAVIPKGGFTYWWRGRREGIDCRGAMVLLARIARADDAEVIACLEATASRAIVGQTATDQLRYLGSAESRRALFRLAGQPGRLAGGSAFRYVYSLEKNPVTAQEQRLAGGELCHLLSAGITLGDAERRGLKLLREYTEQDFGKDWDAWETWLRKHRPEYWEQKKR